MSAEAANVGNRGARYASRLDDLIGNTPLLRLPCAEPSAILLAKLEFTNPLGSTKDRAAAAMLDSAQASGLLPAGGTVVEATSGNTGIALAALCAARGYRCIIVLPDNATTERVALLHLLGAQVHTTPAAERYAAAITKAQAIHQSLPGSFLASQHENLSNPRAHYDTTGPEIWRDTAGSVDVLICGVGTGGTLSGAARYLKQQRPDVRVVAVEPAGSPLLSGGVAGTHGIPGFNGGFVSPTTDTDLIDDVIAVEDAAALACTRHLSRRHGLLVGVSSGAVFHAATVLAGRGELSGKTAVAVFPDGAERYTSILLPPEDR